MIRTIIRRMLHALSARVQREMFRLTIATRWHWPLVRYFVHRVVEVSAPASREAGARPLTILALNPDRFVEDLEILAATGEFRVLRAPLSLQKQLVGHFFDEQLFANVAHQTDEGRRARANLRDFLRQFLERLYSQISIQCVIGAAHYQQDVDWGVVSHELGVPYVILYKENLQASIESSRYVDKFARDLGRFSGTHMIVHTERSRQIWVKSGFVAADRISALGALRMDKFLGDIRRSNGSGRARKRVVFFSFSRGTSLLSAGVVPWPENPDAGLTLFFENAHAAFAELAIEIPDVDFLIKPKWSARRIGGQRWIAEIRRALLRRGISSLPPNLVIDSDVKAHDIIIDSDVILGFGSTTLIEGAIAKKPVIVPFFDEASEERYADHILLRDHFDLFDVAESPDQLKKMIREKLGNPVVSPAVQTSRSALFEEYLSSARGDATLRYVDMLKTIIATHTAGSSAPRHKGMAED